MKYYNWQKPTTADKVKFRKESPNLVQLCEHLIKVYGGSKVGIYNKRSVRGGDDPSSHTFGAALDWRYDDRRRGVSAATELIKNHEKYGVQVVIDYVGCRQWIVGSGWKPLTPNKVKGFGEPWAKWLHVETSREAWSDGREISGR
jgi:hypothetical protein